MKHRVSPLYQDEMGIQRVILNPKVPIPMQVCRICWNILDDDTAYCRRCGHVGTVFSTASIFHQKCFAHKSKDAVHFCNYCSRPFCEECLETNKGSILSMGTYSYHCHLCLADIDRITKQQSNRDKTLCSRHTDMHTGWTCVACGDGVCSFCAYHPVVGLFKKHVEDAIFCFSCISGLVY
jgi:hypothetical protein